MFQGPGARHWAFLPCNCASRACEGPPGRGRGGAPSPASTSYSAHSHIADPGILQSQKREKEFPKVMGPVPHAHPQAECQDPARQVGRWGRAQGSGPQPGVGRNDTEISSPAQVLAQAGFLGGSSHGQRHLGVVGWPRRLRKLIYVPAASSLPKDDQIIGAKTAGFSGTWRQTQMPVLSTTAWARPR